MAETAIEWTDVTWNPTTGCDRISPGCDNCYALSLAKRLKAMGQPKYQADGDPRTSGPGFGLTSHEKELDAPLRWRKPRMVFVNSMSDLFHNDVPTDFIERAFAVMAGAHWHTFQVLTKRPQRMARLLASAAPAITKQVEELQRVLELRIGGGSERPPWPLSNVWLGTSIENNRYAWRADRLRETPAAVRFLSLEPLLGPVPSLALEDIDWVIVGGESGRGARPLDLGWVREIATACTAAGSALFVKQLGTAWSVNAGHGRTHGGDWSRWPEDLRVRRYPAA